MTVTLLRTTAQTSTWHPLQPLPNPPRTLRTMVKFWRLSRWIVMALRRPRRPFLPSLRFQRVRFTERGLLHPFTATAPISVQGINDSGQIVGYDGYFQGFLGTPVHRNATLPHLEVMLGGRKT